MNAHMISFWGCETNPYANPDTANNGGGYSQPSGSILVALENGEYLTVTVDDMSCGDFGSRIGWTIDSSDSRRWGGCYGTMDDAMVDNKWSKASLDSISGVYGVNARAMLHDTLSAAALAVTMNKRCRPSKRVL